MVVEGVRFDWDDEEGLLCKEGKGVEVLNNLIQEDKL
jgi:hypothetical protein